MFEKFSERCRKGISLARQEALSLNQEFIGTEHLLLGLLQVGGGVAAKALEGAAADPAELRREIEKRLPPRSSSPERSGQVPFSPGSKRATELAGEAAAALGHDTIGTEHLLLGLLRENEGIAAQSLRALGLEYAPLLAKVQEALEPEPRAPSTPPWKDSAGDLRRHAFAIKPLTNRPSIEEPLTALLMQGRSVALVGPKHVGKTSVVLAMARAKAGTFAYRTLDHRMFDEFISPLMAQSRHPGTVCFIPQAELLTESRSYNANHLEDRMNGGERLILEFREAGLGRFAERYPFIAKDLVTVEVKAPDAGECRSLLAAAKARLQETAQLQIGDDTLQEADGLAREHCRHLIAPWPTIMILWAAESIQRETSARGDEQQLLKDIADLEKSGDREQAEILKHHLEGLRSILGTGFLSIESVRRAIGELSGPG